MDVRTSADIAARCQDLSGQIDALWTALPLDADGGEASDRLRQLLGKPPDLIVREVGEAVRVLYLKTIVDADRLEKALIMPLALLLDSDTASDIPKPATFSSDLSPLRTYGEALRSLLGARAVVLCPGVAGGFTAAVEKWPQREITEPPAEVIAQGPHNGFVENLDINLAQIRHGIPDRRLRWQSLQLGQRSAADVALVYIEGVVRADLLAEVLRALRTAQPSFVTDSSMLGQWLTPGAHLFPTVGTTERPDRACAALLEGRVAIFVGGSPVALLVPQVFAHLLHAPEDYYNRAYSATLERTLRLVGVIAALVVSPLYVALTTVNLELIPTPLFISIAQARLGVPIPTVAEILGLEVLVEVIRQAGLRLPSNLGQPVAIIGAVVIGQSAVIAGLISAPAVVVVSLSFIVSFILPSQDAAMALRALRFPLILMAGVFGLFGIIWSLTLLFIYLAAIDSFGVPYLAPVTPLRPRGLQDTIWRRSLPALRRSFVARSAGDRL